MSTIHPESDAHLEARRLIDGHILLLCIFILLFRIHQACTMSRISMAKIIPVGEKVLNILRSAKEILRLLL
jgi:hypothetical protein